MTDETNVPTPNQVRRGLAARVVRRPILVIMFYAALTLFGVYSLMNLPVDLLPKIEAPVITIITVYPGAGPSDVETKVTDVIERSVGTLSGLDRLTSSSKENLSAVTCEFAYGTDLEAAANDIRQRMEFAQTFLPSDAHKPMIFKFNTSMFPVFIVGVLNKRGDVRPYRKVIEEHAAEPLERIPGVGSVMLLNAPKRRVLIEVNRPALDARGISLLRLTQTLARANLSVPAGRVLWNDKDLPVRVPGTFQNLDDIRMLPIGFSVVRPFAGAMRYDLQEPYSNEMSVVRLKDVATVHWAMPDRRSVALFQDQDTTWLMVFKKSGVNTVQVANRVMKSLSRIQAGLPSELKIVPILDGSEMIRQTIDNLTSTVWIGSILVVLVIFLFLRRIRTSLVVAVTIPASIVTTFLVMYLMGYTINSISLLAMALGIGMVVDNAIVVLESITLRVERGEDPHDGAISGTKEVALAISASTLTTVVIFAPLVFMHGFIGIIFGQLALVIVVTLLSSLMAALLLTPTLTALILKRGGTTSGSRRFRPLAWFHDRSERVLTAVESGYGRLISGALHHRWLVVGIAILISGASGFLVYATGIDFVTKDDEGFIQVTVEMPEGCTLTETTKVARTVAAEFRKEPEVRSTFLNGGTTDTAMMSSIGGKEGPNIAQVYTRLIAKVRRTRSEDDVAEAVLPRIRKRFPKVRFTARTGNPLGQAIMGTEKPIALYLKGKKFSDLTTAAHQVLRILKSIPGVRNATAEIMPQRPGFQVDVNRRKASQSLLNATFIGATVRAALYGKKVGTYHGKSQDADLFVRLRPQDRNSPQAIEALKITTGLPLIGPPLVGASGPTMLLGLGAERLVPLGAVAQVIRSKAPTEIHHMDKQRMIVVGANYKGRALGDIISDLDHRLSKETLPGDVSYSYGSQVKRQKDSLHDLIRVLLLGIALVYMVMAAQFESLLDPFVIMFSLPFAFTGVFLGFLATGTKLSLPAFLGLIVLMGIVVNNAIVLLDYARQLRDGGMGLTESLVAAGRRRLRPVLMTTFTTIFGMLPLALTQKEGAYLWAPMGQAVASGLLVSTLVTLILIPVVYSLTDRLRRRSRHVPVAPKGETNAAPSATNG